MPKQELIQPEFQKTGFTCPHCNFNSQQVWSSEELSINSCFILKNGNYEKIYYSQCQQCQKVTFWYNKKMIYPQVILVDDPNEEMPEEVKFDYNEAALIVEKSPRAAAALLRLAIEKLCNYLGETGKIDTMIGNLVKKGLSAQVKQALDIVRVIGNEGVHAGQIDLKDDKETVYTLFKLVNFICEKMITDLKYVHDNFSNLPSDKLKGIENRDK